MITNMESFSLIIIPILIFLARVLDVTFGTMRIIFISRSSKYAPIFGFFEILIWLFAISQIMQHINNIIYYLSYAFGYATGTYVGILIEDKIAIGRVILRIITKKDATELVGYFRSTGYGVTVFEGLGSTGQVKLIYMTIERKDIDKILDIIKKFNPKAFFSVEEVRVVKEGIFPLRKSHHWSFDLGIIHSKKVNIQYEK